MTAAIKLSIVFLNFNKRHETQSTCEQLLKVCANRNDIEIIAVDNGSTDGTAEYLQNQQHIIAILLANNSGISGYNAGFEKSRGKYLLVLDDDSFPLKMSDIDRCIQTLEHCEEIGIIAAHIQSADGTAQWSWHLPQSNQLTRSPFFIGCGFIIRRDLFARIGWYPSNFFLYQNEIEVSFQTRLQGYDIFYDPKFIVIHHGTPNQRPSYRRVFFPTRNTLWILRKFYPQPQVSYLILSRLIIGFVRALRFGELNAFFKAAQDGLRQPINKTLLSSSIRAISKPFWKQNSIIHQLLRRT